MTEYKRVWSANLRVSFGVSQGPAHSSPGTSAAPQEAQEEKMASLQSSEGLSLELTLQLLVRYLSPVPAPGWAVGLQGSLLGTESFGSWLIALPCPVL